MPKWLWSAYNKPYGTVRLTLTAKYITEAHIAALTLDDVSNYYCKRFVPNNAYLVVTGDVNPEEVITLVNEHFRWLATFFRRSSCLIYPWECKWNTNQLYRLAQRGTIGNKGYEPHRPKNVAPWLLPSIGSQQYFRWRFWQLYQYEFAGRTRLYLWSFFYFQNG